MKTHTMPDGTVMPGATHGASGKEQRPVAQRDSKKKYQMTKSQATGADKVAQLAKAMGLKKG